MTKTPSYDTLVTMPNIIVTTDDVVSIQDAAKELKVARLTIYRWIKASKIISIKFGGFLFIPKSEIERLQHGND